MTALSLLSICIALTPLQRQEAGSQEQGTPQRAAPIASLSAKAKIEIAHVKFALASKPKGILDSLALTPNKPMVVNKGRLYFRGFTVESSHSGPGKAFFGGYGDPGPTNFPSYIHLEFLVARPNKKHLVTFYLTPYYQTGKVVFNITNLPSKEETFESIKASGAAFLVFTPTKIGPFGIQLRPDRGLAFHRVEVDVLD